MQIGQVARSTGLSIDTIRFYEKQGLVHAPPRSSGGYRVYDERDVERFQFVGRAQNLGFSLRRYENSWSLRTAKEMAAPTYMT